MKTIRVWNGCTVVGLLTVGEDSSSFQVAGGAHNSSKPDIELDPWAGLIVDHSTGNPPQLYRLEESE